MMFTKFSKTGFFAVIFSTLIKICSFFKVSFILGSFTALFSATNMITPLAGSFGGLGGSAVVCGLGLAIRFFLFGKLSFLYLAYHIPGMFAGFYWSSKSAIIRVLVPLSCMLLFVAHPVGGQAFLYSFYWLIPVVLYFVSKKPLFLEALGSTFVAHAVGSVIWLYAAPAVPAFWLGLIPVVFAERLVFAGGMVVAHKVLQSSYQFLSEKASFVRLFPAQDC